MSSKAPQKPPSEKQEQREAPVIPIMSIIQSALAIGIFLLSPIGFSFWLAIIFPALGFINYLLLNSQARQKGMTDYELIDERNVFGIIAILITVTGSGIIAGALSLLDHPALSVDYIGLTAAAIAWFLLGMMLWRFTSPTEKTIRDTRTRGTLYGLAIKSVIYLLFVQQAITEYFIGGNDITTAATVLLVMLPLLLWYRASIIFKVLGYHPDEAW